jgi:hypothetical protein
MSTNPTNWSRKKLKGRAKKKSSKLKAERKDRYKVFPL